MFSFQWPWMALLLPLPLLAYLFWPRTRSRAVETPEGEQVTLLHPDLALLAQIFPSHRPARPLVSRLYRTLQWLLWLLLVLALMGPQWLTPQRHLKTNGHDLLLTVDASHSMEALDFSVQGRQVSRMSVLKGVMGRFVSGRVDDRIGLIIFGSQAYVLAPLSPDRLAVQQILEGLVPGIAGPGTALGDAITLSVKKLRERPEGSRVMVLIADGDNTSGIVPPVEAARIARHEGARIYVIGVGSLERSIPIMEAGRIVHREDLSMDETVLRQIASITDGVYFRATDTQALETIYARIDALEKTEVETHTTWIPAPLYRWPLGAALLILLVLGMFPDGRKRVFAR